MSDLVVPGGHPPTRLDRFVADAAPGLSRRRLRGADLRVNGRRASHGVVVRPGDVISVPDELLKPPEIDANAGLALPILHADEAILAVDKPAGISSVALSAADSDTVANFLAGAHPELRGVGPPLEAGLVHRLDRDTSGVLLAARTVDAYAHIRRQFSRQVVAKEYLALVEGDLGEAGAVDVPIAHDPHRATCMRACGRRQEAEQLRARPAATRYQPVIRLGGATFLRLAMRTGVRHQIRVHLASIGHPILGDTLYGRASPAIARQALHASRVSLRHPRDGTAVIIESPLPRDFELALRGLRDGGRVSPLGRRRDRGR